MTNLLLLPPELLIHIEQQFLSWKLERYPGNDAWKHMLRLSQAHPALRTRRQHVQWQCLYSIMWWEGHPPTPEHIYPPEGWREPPLWQSQPWRPMSAITLQDTDLPPTQRRHHRPRYSSTPERYSSTSDTDDDATSH